MTAEIAEMVGKSEENCRQIVRRARQHLNGPHPHRKVSVQQREQLTQQFLRACTSGDMGGLLSLLTEDVVLHADGGGKVNAARKPIYGAENVARGLLGILRKFSRGVTPRIMVVNGQPGIVGYLGETPVGVIVLDVRDGHIREVNIVVNPDKLRQIPALS